ncbi:fimbria/pilus chaperone family protein [Castellaniella ginsengisoli]|uniref:Fimbria/pilus chaperone family protein n=1 Tax=Castellaniella ginsengisoli TaxID=546114 RepID=A0AB39CQD8_9BURK
MHKTLKSAVALSALHGMLSLFAVMSGATQAHAAGMRPETSVVIVEESDGEASMNVRNTDDAPALLYTSLRGIPEDDEDLLIVTPPVARVEPGQTQLVRFILQPHEPFKTERLRRVVFDGIPPKSNAPGVRVNVNFRQNLPVLIRPAGLAQDPEPWKRLKWSVDGTDLKLENPSPYVVRLSPEAALLPSGARLNLDRTYILPNQTFSFPLHGGAAGLTGVRINPATAYGFAAGAFEAPLAKRP